MIVHKAAIQKIAAEHLARKAVVYLRQSSPQQVKQNKESQHLQYALVDRAKALGFGIVEVIDCDLGASAGFAAASRAGFKQLLASVTLGEVGLVLSRELSRLSRTDKDWCQLMELCQVFNTLLADADHLYDLNVLDDQLILGIKGTLSVVELKVLKLRMLAGMQAKAKRGELVRVLAPGYVRGGGNGIVKDPNLRVKEAVELVFKKFRELGSIRQVHRWFHEERVDLPVNKRIAGRFGLVWQPPTMSFVSDVLRNPLYAGAYVYGRRPIEIVVKAGQAVKRQRSALVAEEAQVFIRDHHEGYIGWEDYQHNQQTLRNNGGNFTSDESVTAVRAGHGLLVGLLRCGRCGRKLHIRYWGKHGTAARYLCSGDFASGGEYCLGFGGAKVDQRVSEEIQRAIAPLGIEASLAAIAQHHAATSDRRAALARKLEQLEYEARRAFEQYDQADPHNRLVAEVLERRWNEKLEAVEKSKAELAAESAAAPPLTAAEKASIMALGEQFASVWDAPSCPIVLKKKIVRTLIKEIIVDANDDGRELRFIVHWQGGCHTTLAMPKPLSGAVAHKTSLEDVELITRMARRYQDDEIARVLSKLGRRTGKGHRWTSSGVAFVRKKYQLPAVEEARSAGDLLTLGQATKYCGVSDTALMKLIRKNVLAAEQIAPYAPLEIKRADLDSEPVARVLERLKATGKLVLEGNTLENQQGLFD